MEITSEPITGFLAYLDLLGFSNKIQTDDFEEEFEKYCTTLKSLLDRYPRFSYLFFSDSIVIYSDKIDMNSLAEMVSILSILFFRLVTQHKLPLCGAVSCGNFVIHTQNGNKMIAGSPMVEAVEYEQKQNWIGIMLHQTVIEKTENMKWLINTALHHRTYDMLYESNSLWWYSHLYRYDEIPMQESSNLVLLREGFALIPHNGNAKKFSELHDQILGFHKELVYLKYSAPTHVQQKYNYTINMLDELMDTFHQFGEKQIRKGR